MSLLPSTNDNEAFYHGLCELMARHSENMSPLEMLAVAANMVGKLLAMQDQTAITVSGAMEVIAKNIEYGNRTLVQALRSGPPTGTG